LVCMDEPTMGLAPIFVDRVLDQIVAVNKRGTAIFIVEQNASLALSIAHRGYVLRTGRIVLEGLASELLASEQIREAYLGRRSTGEG
ncbi:MAG TPA: ABC transporter ATP-binding protein, partial [Thermoanaerobaculia bacterium]|nr:ABC transporter ATP-binding protein [Thermoanaerobaculia bacterium]